MGIESLARSLQSKNNHVSTCTYALIRHFCTQLADIRSRSAATPLETEAVRLVEWWHRDFLTIHGELSFGHSSNAKVKPDWLQTAFSLNDRAQPLDILCAAETCFSLLVRVLAYHRVATHLGEAVSLEHLAAPEALADVLHGDFFLRHYIHNYCFPDAYSWFLCVWNKNTEHLLRPWLTSVHACLTETDGTSVSAEKQVQPASRDSFTHLYEALFPRQLRHALGEFYTPQWLAEYTVAETFAKSGAVPWQAVCLDPTCGSGTFLRALVGAIRRAGDAEGGAHSREEIAYGRPETPTAQLQRLCQVVRGYDVNLLAVIMARTNFLFDVLDLWDGRVDIHLPIDWFDVLDRPHTEDGRLTVSLHGKPIATTLQSRARQDGIARRADHAASVPERLQRVYIANRLRGAAHPPADIVVGNPPWVNWEYLSKSVRDRTGHLWQTYALFDAAGRDRALAKEDLSTLLTYAVADRDLRVGGCLGFVLRQAVFKSKQNGAGFRRLQLGRSGPALQVLQVDDLSLLQPFPGASTATAVVWLRKAETTAYPVPWRIWRPQQAEAKKSIARPAVDFDLHMARPVQEDVPTSPWITLPSDCFAAAKRVLGHNSYRARTGVFTGGANAVFWTRVLSPSGDGLVRVENVTERAKRRAPSVIADVEPLFLYPLLRGADVKRWQAEPQLHLLCPHTKETRMAAVSQATLAAIAPRTLAYLEQFTDVLLARRGFSWDRVQLERTPYAIQRIGAYTFAPYKVVWRYIASSFICAVVSSTHDPVLGPRLVLPNEKLMFIPTADETEAYYLCGVLSSTPVRACIEQVMNPTSISTHVVDNLSIPTFEAHSPLHRRIAALCQAGHALLRRADSQPRALVDQTLAVQTTAEVDAQLDEAVCTLYNLTPADLTAFSTLTAKR